MKRTIDGMTVRGDHMCKKLQDEALRMFVHRYTGNNKPAWTRADMPNGKPYPLQFKNDAEWLANTFFYITKQGEFDKRRKYCESHPTWPNNPELRR